MKKISALALILFLSSCASYSVTEGEIQDYLDSRAAFERTIGIKGLAYANVKFSDINIGIGRIADNRVNLDANTQAKLMISGQPQKEININVSFSAIPYYDKEEGAIFLNDLEMESLDILPKELNDFAGKQLISPIVQLIGQIILTHPVYRLDENDFKKSALKTAQPELIIKNHTLVVQL